MSRWLTHWGLREAPFTKEIGDADLWVPTSRLGAIERLIETCRDHGHALLLGERFTTCNPFVKSLAAQKGPRRAPAEIARLLVEMYLSDATLANVDEHCPLIALPSDVARAGLEPRSSYTTLVENMAHVFRGALSSKGKAAERTALLIVNLCVGGMVLARTTDDPKLQKELRSAARAQALALLAAG